MPKQAQIEIHSDQDCESPLEGSDWEVKSFLDRRGRTDIREAFPEGYYASGEQKAGFRRKLAVGTAFWLKCYRHSCEVWSLQGDGRFYHHGDWDTSNFAGLLLFTGNPKHLPKDKEARRKMAQETIDTYTQWVNGEACGWVLKDVETGETLDSVWGFIGDDAAEADAKEWAGRNDYEVLPGAKRVY